MDPQHILGGGGISSPILVQFPNIGIIIYSHKLCNILVENAVRYFMAQTLIKRSPFSASVISGHTPMKFVICIVERTSFTALWRRAQNKSRCQDTAVTVVVRAVLKLRARIHIMKNAATKISDYVRQSRHTPVSQYGTMVL